MRKRQLQKELDYERYYRSKYEQVLNNLARLNLSNKEARSWIIDALGYVTYAELIDQEMSQRYVDHAWLQYWSEQ